MSTNNKSDPIPDYLPARWTSTITISHLAEFLTPNQSQKIIYGMIQRGELPMPFRPRKRGRCNLWLKHDINEWIHLGFPKNWRRGG